LYVYFTTVSLSRVTVSPALTNVLRVVRVFYNSVAVTCDRVISVNQRFACCTCILPLVDEIL